MATAKQARVAAATQLSTDTRLLDLELEEPLGFVGGQYIIVDTGLTTAEGKRVKRAYSILSADERQDRVQIAVKRLERGAGSSHMHSLAAGDAVSFSGPWGQYLPDDSQPRRTLIVASDTGITAALGLVRGQRFAPQRALTTVVWLVEQVDYFLPESLVSELLPAGVAFELAPLAPVGAEDRAADAAAHWRWAGEAAEAEPRPESVYLSGDGLVVSALAELFKTRAPAATVRVEHFFNNPNKKSA
jgi:ferredoxin-NADP reductase